MWGMGNVHTPLQLRVVLTVLPVPSVSVGDARGGMRTEIERYEGRLRPCGVLRR